MRMGWVGRRGQVVFEPIPGIRDQAQVPRPGRRVDVAGYLRNHVKERGYRPEPYAIADALVKVDGKAIVELIGISLQLTGTDRNELEAALEWIGRAIGRRPRSTADRRLLRPRADSRICAGQAGRSVRRALPAVCGRPPLSGAVAGASVSVRRSDHSHRRDTVGHAAGTSAVAEYDIDPDAWFFEADRGDSLPFAILLEVALQPCGWLAAYMGSALEQ